MSGREARNVGRRAVYGGHFCVALAIGCVAASAEVHAQDSETRIYFNDRCVIADEPFVLRATGPDVPKIPAFLSFLLLDSARSALATRVTRSAGQLLQRLGAARNVSSHVTQSIYLYSVDSATSPDIVFTPDLGCMTVVRAQFEPEGAQCADDYVPKTLAEGYILDEPKSWQSTRADEGRRNILRRANICVAAEPEVLVEARFEYSEDGTAFRLVPVGSAIRSLESARRDGDVRTLVYTVSLMAPRAAAEPAATYAALWLSLGEIRAGDESFGAAPGSAPPSWAKLPSLPAESRSEYEADLALHRELQAQIDALRRAGSRYELQIEELAAREAVAEGAVRAALAGEREQATVKSEIAKAQLAAALREYAALSRVSKSYMPAMLVATANEVRSERAALTLVGQLLEDAAPLAGEAVVALRAKSVDASLSGGNAEGIEEDVAAAYHDLLVEQSLARAVGEPTEELDALVDAARRRVAEERRQRGLTP